MQASQIPTKIQLAFANAGDKISIPVASQSGGAASFTDGFPPLNGIDIADGGVPPARNTFNGILYDITSLQLWQSAGGLFPYDATYATAIGGYPQGALLASTTAGKVWLCTADNNTTDPDGASPANWLGLLNQSAADALYAAIGGPTTPVDHGPSGSNDRVTGTVYQNTQPYPLKLAVVLGIPTGTGAADAAILIGSTSSPTVAIEEFEIAQNSTNLQIMTLRGEVPPNWYYEISAGSGVTTPALRWYEG